jgi:hypothetical protein
MNEGALRVPCWPRMPVLTGVGSLKPFSGRWQVAQDSVPSADRRVS